MSNDSVAGTVPEIMFDDRSSSVNNDRRDSVEGRVPHRRLPCRSRNDSAVRDVTTGQSLDSMPRADIPNDLPHHTDNNKACSTQFGYLNSTRQGYERTAAAETTAQTQWT